MKDAWDSKRDVLVKSGAFAIEQLSEALSSSASSNKLPDGLPQIALRLCAEQVGVFTVYIKKFFVFMSFGFASIRSAENSASLPFFILCKGISEKKNEFITYQM